HKLPGKLSYSNHKLAQKRAPLLGQFFSRKFSASAENQPPPCVETTQSRCTSRYFSPLTRDFLALWRESSNLWRESSPLSLNFPPLSLEHNTLSLESLLNLFVS